MRICRARSPISSTIPFARSQEPCAKAGGFAKDTTPFSEFAAADFLRRRIKAGLVRRSFDKALDHALAEAKTEEASYLPGWSGPSGD